MCVPCMACSTREVASVSALIHQQRRRGYLAILADPAGSVLLTHCQEWLLGRCERGQSGEALADLDHRSMGHMHFIS